MCDRFSIESVEVNFMAKIERATFAGGWFWDVEAVLQEVEGVIDTSAGYAGGHTDNPTYESVCYTDTGHAEVVQVDFDPEIVSFEHLLDALFKVANPTVPGDYCGGQYRTGVFYHNDQQKEAIEKLIKKFEAMSPRPVFIEVSPAPKFYEAEEYHQDYYKKKYGAGVKSRRI